MYLPWVPPVVFVPTVYYSECMSTSPSLSACWWCWKQINWFCCLTSVRKIYNGSFLWPDYAKVLFLCVWYLFSVNVSLDYGSQHSATLRKLQEPLLLAIPCGTAIHRWNFINWVISSEENRALEVRLLQRDHPCTVQAVAALEGLQSGTTLRFLGNNIYVLVPKLLPVFSHVSQSQTELL